VRRPADEWWAGDAERAAAEVERPWMHHIYGVVTLDDLLRHVGSETDRLTDTVLSQARHLTLP